MSGEIGSHSRAELAEENLTEETLVSVDETGGAGLGLIDEKAKVETPGTFIRHYEIAVEALHRMGFGNSDTAEIPSAEELFGRLEPHVEWLGKVLGDKGSMQLILAPRAAEHGLYGRPGNGNLLDRYNQAMPSGSYQRPYFQQYWPYGAHDHSHDGTRGLERFPAGILLNYGPETVEKAKTRAGEEVHSFSLDDEHGLVDVGVHTKEQAEKLEEFIAEQRKAGRVVDGISATQWMVANVQRYATGKKPMDQQSRTNLHHYGTHHSLFTLPKMLRRIGFLPHEIRTGEYVPAISDNVGLVGTRVDSSRGGGHGVRHVLRLAETPTR